MEKQQLIRWLQAEIARVTGRRYEIDFEALDLRSLRDFHAIVTGL